MEVAADQDHYTINEEYLHFLLNFCFVRLLRLLSAALTLLVFCDDWLFYSDVPFKRTCLLLQSIFIQAENTAESVTSSY